MVLNALKQHCRGGVAKHHLWVKTGQKADGSDALRETEMSFIPEGDVYRLICSSQLPTAEKFERWVFDEVLPTIRKHGAFMTPEKIEEALLDPEYLMSVV